MAAAVETGFELRSMAFAHNGHIPAKYSCEGEDINPDIEFTHLPEGAKSIALIMEDHDAPNGIFDHWIAWNIQPNEAIAEKTNPGISGRNSFGKTGYGGPCPPSGVHRYFFKAFALDTQLELQTGAGKEELLEAMEGHILATAEIVGLYARK